jgi:hypothetical protein
MRWGYEDIPSSRAEPKEAPGYVLPETTALAVIGCLDLVSTIYLIGAQRAGEANPLMATLLHEFGPLGLIGGKVALLAGPLVIAELARKRNPRFVQSALRVGIVLYLAFYAIGFTRLNP